MLAKMVAINSMKKHSLYGSALFWVDVHKKSDKPPFAIPKSLFIGVKVNKFQMLVDYFFFIINELEFINEILNLFCLFCLNITNKF